MDTLRNLFGNFTSTIFRLVVVVGTMAAVYFFIVKPTLDTTEEISNRAFDSSDRIFDQDNDGTNDIQRQIQKQIRDTNKQIQKSIQQSVNQTQQAGGGNPQALLRCVQRAQGDVDKIQVCSEKF